MSAKPRFRFQLFVAGNASNSLAAVANLRALCKARLPDQHEIELVDVFVHPLRALEERIVMTPTLLVVEPGPTRRIIGNLSETRVVLQTLGLGPVQT